MRDIFTSIIFDDDEPSGELKPHLECPNPWTMPAPEPSVEEKEIYEAEHAFDELEVRLRFPGIDVSKAATTQRPTVRKAAQETQAAVLNDWDQQIISDSPSRKSTANEEIDDDLRKRLEGKMFSEIDPNDLAKWERRAAARGRVIVGGF